jgi:hypothetical protein
MADTRTLTTVQQDVCPNGTNTVLSVKGGQSVFCAIEDAASYLHGAIHMLGDVAANCTENSHELYNILNSATIARALLDSVVKAIYQADHGKRPEMCDA